MAEEVRMHWWFNSRQETVKENRFTLVWSLSTCCQALEQRHHHALAATALGPCSLPLRARAVA